MRKLFLLFILTILPLAASADAVEINGIYYNLASGKINTASVTSNPNKYSGEVVIPASVSYNDADYSVTSIGGSAFQNCSGLTSVTIPNSVTSISYWAFSNCRGLTSIAIPNSVTSIGAHAFDYCSSLTSLTIPNSVTSIDTYAFARCSGLTSVSIPNSVTSIESYTFSGCSSLTSVTIPNSVSSIGVYAFNYCSGMTSVTIPNSVTTIGDCAFIECSGLTSVQISDLEAWCMMSFTGSYSNPLYYAHHLYLNGEEILDLEIPNSVTSIGNFAFNGCSGLTSVTIPNSVTSIGRYAFAGCCGLTSVTIPNSVTTIENSTFSGCNSLPSVTIPNSVTSIGTYAFYYCSALASVTIGNSVISIDKFAFSKCIGLTSVTIPNSVTLIGESAFSGCSGLIAVDFSNNLTIIKKEAFYECSSLESIIIPASVEYIYEKAFADCPKLASVKSMAENPPFLYDNSFSNYEIPLFVPPVSIDSYKAANGWKNFTNILSIDAAKHTLTYLVDGEVYKTYELYEGELITPEPSPTKEGYEFSGWSTIPPTMPAEDLTIKGTFTLITDYDEIKITSAGQTTWCSKYDLDFTDVEGMKAYIATGYDRITGTIWLSRVFQVPAKTGVLLIGKEDTYKVPHKTTGTYYVNMFVGTLEAMTLNETDGEYTNYYLSKGTEGVGFYKVKGSVNLGAHRAYLPLLKGTTDAANTRYIGFTFDDGATSIDPLSASDADDSNAAYYNLQGLRMDNPAKGLYISKGKMVIVR